MEPAEPEQYAALERFILNNPDLERLESLLSEFDLFRLLDLDRQEEIHSRVLAWLLNPHPQQDHYLGDYFLKKFLVRTLSRALETGISTVTPVEIAVADCSGAKVQREWYNVVDHSQGYLDILVVDERQQFLCAVENKVYSGEHGGQLTRYRQALESDYPDFSRHYVFLSRGGYRPQEEEERRHWVTLDYDSVCQLVEGIPADRQDSLIPEIRVFIQQYAHTLRRYIVNEQDLRSLARKIYEQHSTAIELIYQHKPDYQTEVKAILSEVIQEQEGWELERVMLNQKTRHRFFPVEWRDFEAFPTGKRWGRCKAMVLFEFFTLANSLELHLCYCSTERESVREAIDTRLRAFDDLVHWTGEYRSNTPYLGCTIAKGILNSSDFERWNAEAARAKIEAYVSAFAQNQYPQIRDAVTRCLEELEASGQP